MPANRKYLTNSMWQRVAKISASLLGGYLIAVGTHLLLTLWLPGHRVVLVTFRYSLYLLWVVFMFIPFLFENGWKCWLYYFVIIALLAAGIVDGMIYHPIV